MLARLVAALTAGVIAWILPILMGVYVFLLGPGVDAAGKPDNDPYRAAAFLLILSPAFVLLLGAYFYAVSTLLSRFWRVGFLPLLLPNTLVSVVLGIAFYRQGLEIGGVPDAIQSFVIFGGFTLVCLVAGSAFLAWRASRAAV